jgi:hypothetical protein
VKIKRKEPEMSKNIRITALLALTIAPLPALAAPIQAVLYKNPQCTCCEMYADYLRANGFDVQLKCDNQAPSWARAQFRRLTTAETACR